MAAAVRGNQLLILSRFSGSASGASSESRAVDPASGAFGGQSVARFRKGAWTRADQFRRSHVLRIGVGSFCGFHRIDKRLNLRHQLRQRIEIRGYAVRRGVIDQELADLVSDSDVSTYRNVWNRSVPSAGLPSVARFSPPPSSRSRISRTRVEQLSRK